MLIPVQQSKTIFVNRIGLLFVAATMLPLSLLLDFNSFKNINSSLYRSAHKLGEVLHFNDQLDNTRKHFTYFVPRDSAWKKIEVQSPSVYKKVFMPEFAPNVSLLRIF